MEDVQLAQRVIPYPPARWRLASLVRLSNVVVWTSHILIRHRELETDEVPFSNADWTLEHPLPARSRAEALELARQIQREAAANPASFAQLASARSEDISNKDDGGTFGGVQALNFSPWPRLLDTIAALDRSQVSEVVESGYGFHIFQRSAPPDEDTVSGSRIVIGYDGAKWLPQFQARGSAPRRTRAEAAELARAVYAEAVADPSRFEALVERYSEHRDAAVHGDIGAWSTREPTPYPREVDALRRVQVGQVAPPRDSLLGFQILLRTPNRERSRYAAEMIHFGYDPEVAPPGDTSKAAVQALASSLLEQLQREPGLFGELQAKYCCKGVASWREGRQEVPLALAIQNTPLGSVASGLIEDAGQLMIARRVEPAPEAFVPTVFELPSPAAPELGGIVGHTIDRDRLAAGLQQVADEVGASLKLEAQQLGALKQLHDLAGALSAPTTRPDLVLAKLERDTNVLLGAANYTRYRAISDAYFEGLILRPPLH